MTVCMTQRRRQLPLTNNRRRLLWEQQQRQWQQGSEFRDCKELLCVSLLRTILSLTPVQKCWRAHCCLYFESEVCRFHHLNVISPSGAQVTMLLTVIHHAHKQIAEAMVSLYKVHGNHPKWLLTPNRTTPTHLQAGRHASPHACTLQTTQHTHRQAGRQARPHAL